MLYADQSMDLTQDVLAEVNKLYKEKKPETPAKPAEKPAEKPAKNNDFPGRRKATLSFPVLLFCQQLSFLQIICYHSIDVSAYI